MITNDLDKIKFRRIPKFQFEEFNITSQEIANLKDADEDDIKDTMILVFNQTFLDASFEDSWHIAILQILPKDGGLNELNNWRSITILPIFLKIYTQMIYSRISSQLFEHQSWGQYEVTSGIDIEDAFVFAEMTIEYHQEFQLPLWILSMDMLKEFDTIDHGAFMQTLRSKRLFDEYISLLSIFYSG